MFGGSLTVMAQTSPTFPGTQRNDPNLPENQNAPHREMIKELEIRREEGEYKQHVARAKENAQLAVELRETFTHEKNLQAPDIKKLSRMEKLSRQIRSEAGGEEVKNDAKDSPPPPQPEEAFRRLAELTADLQKKVEKTPRQVVSAAVINRANEIIELLKYIHTLYR